MFQSTLPRGERPDSRTISAMAREFQSTLPRGERLFLVLVCSAQLQVSIHAPTRGATDLQPAEERQADRFNPRSHEGSDAYNQRDQIYFRVSIHAPTRGATTEAQNKYNDALVSIHAPTRGATLVTIQLHNSTRSFNPRSHEGSDMVMNIPKTNWTVSIHAPTRGATVP